MSKETRKDFVLVIITSIASAIGMTSVFVACRPLAWVAILISDSYLSIVLLFAAILSDDHAFTAVVVDFVDVDEFIEWHRIYSVGCGSLGCKREALGSR